MSLQKQLLRAIRSLSKIKALLNIKSGFDERGATTAIRDNVNLTSANAWSLIFAIFIASIGLNVNSVAVIIGAMLISPLMGPIVGTGLALGVNDFSLLRRSILNLAYAVGISVVTSTLYFLISPLSEIQSELLARTRPTFYDVLVAILGGAAGIVATSSKERGNAIPGVAIATALMPPLCTAGFGIAKGEIGYLVGALYLFVINSIFICISTYVFVRLMGFRRVIETDGAVNRRLNTWMGITAFVVILPSLFLAWRLQREVLFRSKASAFIENEMRFQKSVVVKKEIEFGWRKEKIVVGLVGDALSPDLVRDLQNRLKGYDIAGEALEIIQISFEESIRGSIADLNREGRGAVKEFELRLSQSEAELKKYKDAEQLTESITGEVATLFPRVQYVLLRPTRLSQKSPAMDVFVQWAKAPTRVEKERLTLFLEKRVQVEASAVVHTAAL